MDPALGSRTLTLVQGHPTLLELADTAAADPARLASQLAAAEAAVDGAALTAFLREGATALDAAQFLHTLTAWTTEAAATLPAPSRLLLQTLCRIEETDRTSTILDGTWVNVWRRLDQSSNVPPLDDVVVPLVATALVTAEAVDPTNPSSLVLYRIHPGIAETINAATPEAISAEVDAEFAAWWTKVAAWAIEQERAGKDTGQLVVRAGWAAAPYLVRQHSWDTAIVLVEQARLRDGYSPITAQAVGGFRWSSPSSGTLGARAGSAAAHAIRAGQPRQTRSAVVSRWPRSSGVSPRPAGHRTCRDGQGMPYRAAARFPTRSRTTT